MRIPKIVWDGKTLEAPYPLDNVVTYPEPREGSEWASAPSGTRDAWIIGPARRLAADWRWIPTVDQTAPHPPGTGWDGATGFAAFLEFARDAQPFDFFPDKTEAASISSVLIEPMRGPPEFEPDGTRRVRLVIESVAGTAFTGY